MEFVSNKQGYCPVCNSSQLNYGSVELEWDMMYYPWECADCGAEGEEWYNVSFNGHNVADKDGVMTEVKDVTTEQEGED